ARAVGAAPQRQPHAPGLGPRPADPAVQLALLCQQRPVADARRGRTLHADHGREGERRPLVRQAAGFDEDVHSARSTWFSASHTLSDVSGMSMFRTPACASGSMTALTNAPGEPAVPDS